jgi:hypothetical protein
LFSKKKTVISFGLITVLMFFYGRFRPLSTLCAPAANEDAADESQNEANKDVNGEVAFHYDIIRLILG